MAFSSATDPRRYDLNWEYPAGSDSDDDLLSEFCWGEMVELTGTPEGLPDRQTGELAMIVAYDKYYGRPLVMFADGTVSFLDELDPVLFVAADKSQWKPYPHLEVSFDASSWNEGYEVADEPLASLPVTDAAAALTEAERLYGSVLPNGQRIEAKVVMKKSFGQPVDAIFAGKLCESIAAAHCDFAP
jgi:hypothetical protein